MTRGYRKTARAESERDTRQKILHAAIDTLARRHEFQVRDVAQAASVTVQTVYAHFGSKAALVMAVLAEVSTTHGLLAGLERVWRRRDGVGALDEMVTVTLDFWRRAWPFIGFSLRVQSSDPAFASMKLVVDESRLADLVRICQRLDDEGVLEQGLSPKMAASLVFALTAPQVYEELVVTGRMPYRTCARELRRLTMSAVVDARAKPRKSIGPPAWLAADHQSDAN